MSQSDCESYLIIVIESKQKGHESEIRKRVIEKMTHVLKSRELSNQ
jgi:hypothetical protein